eukprot:1014964-Rhodomonas_salina.1
MVSLWTQGKVHQNMRHRAVYSSCGSKCTGYMYRGRHSCPEYVTPMASNTKSMGGEMNGGRGDCAPRKAVPLMWTLFYV